MRLYSTPQKQAPLIVSFAEYTSNDADESDLSSVSSASEEESEEEEVFSYESEQDDISISESLFALLDVNSDADDVDCDGILETDTVFSQAQLFNVQKIHENSEMSINEGILQIMDLYVKNQLSKQGLERTVKVMCSFLPENHQLPTSAHSILKYVTGLSPPIPATVHYYCESCLTYCGSIADLCEVCNVPTSFGRFFTFNIAALVKFFFEHRDLASIIDSNNNDNNNGDSVNSLKDGSVYKSFKDSIAKYDLSLVFGTDGVRIRKGPKELWLSMFTIAEVPVHLQRSFLTVIGVWYDSKKPDMKTFLKPFAEEMELLDQVGYECGVEWSHPLTKESHKSVVRLLVTVLDSPARSMVQNVMLYNSRYGCNMCEIKTQRTPVEPEVKRRRVYYYCHHPKLRTKENMLKQAEDAAAREVPVKGVRGLSVLSLIPSVDMSKCVVPEYLHSVCLGVVKQLLVTWTEKAGEWCIANQITEIDAFLRTFKHPSFVHRSVRQLKSLKFWKASDFYYFLLFESLPSLSGHLPQKFLQHLMLLIRGIFTLLKSHITEAEIDEAEKLLKLFTLEFGILYGNRQLTSNVHQLIHLALCVRMFGPLHCFSAFSLEDLNGLIARTTHGSKEVDMEIVNNIKICQGITILRNIVSRDSDGPNFSDAHSSGEFLGKILNVMLSPDDLQMLQDNEPTVYSRAKLGYDEYTSVRHKPLATENFHIMWEENGQKKFGSILYFAQTKADKYVVIRVLPVNHTKVFCHYETMICIENFVPVEFSDTIVAVPFTQIVPCITKVGKIGCYMYKRPNRYRYVM